MQNNLFFPHDTVRDGQKELVEDIQKVLAEKKILLAHAPTGLGKTASALSVALQVALEQKKIVFFLTNRHTQHLIAIETLKLMKEKSGKDFTVVDLIGKRWMCNQDVANLFGNDFMEYCKSVVERGECEFYNNVYDQKKLKVEAKAVIEELQRGTPKHTEELMVRCQEQKMCSYEIAVSLAKKATVLIGDYYYLFSPFVRNNIFGKMEKEMEDIIVIVDEGHNLPSRMTDMLSTTLNSLTLKNALIEAKKFGFGGMIVWLQGLMNVLNTLAVFTEEREKKVERAEFMSLVTKFVDYDLFTNELEMAADDIRKKQRRSYLGGIAAFLDAWKSEEEGFVRYIEERRSKFGPFIQLNYSCLDPAIVTRDIFKRVHAGVIMSGTLKPTFMFKDILGIEKSVEKEYASPFPPENKLTLVVPETTTKYTLRGEAMYQKIAGICSEIAGLIPGNMALFFPSYDLRDAIAQHIVCGKKAFLEKQEMSKEEKDAFLGMFKAEKDRGGLLLGVTGANFAEGIDLPGDLLQGVVVVGLPLAKPDLKTREIISYYDKKFGKGWDYGYTYPAMSKCIQSAGRCIRSETDRGAVVFLDERFAWQRYYDCLPERVGLRVTKEYGKLVKEFFAK
ncbi:ATP-dependent DNA helicase [Candidatus Woesearchaeota archaeon]|nr:ATP-dependent DNA helicase [Candidatus Woesearchaeota archaeon]